MTPTGDEGAPEPGALRALVEGARLLAAHPGSTGAALVVGALGALALTAGRVAGAARLDGRAPGASIAAAATLFLLGGSVAALSWGAALSASLARERPRPLAALRQGTGAISLIAVERLIQFSLVLAAAMPLGRWWAANPEAATLARALAATAALAPTLPLWLITVPAFAIAVARAAAGEPGYQALPVGLAVTLGHLGLVARAGLLALTASAALWVPPLALGGRMALARHPLLAIAATALGGALGMAASLLTYATLHAVAEAVAGRAEPPQR